MKLRYIICFFSCIFVFTFVYYIGYSLLPQTPRAAQDKVTAAQTAGESKAIQAAESKPSQQLPESEAALPAQETPAAAEYAFFVTAENGLVTVYEKDCETVYLHTSIEISLLSEEEQHRLLKGFYVASELELFDCLENYTS